MAFILTALAEGLGAGMAAEGGAMGTAAAASGGGLAAAEGTAATGAFGRSAAFSAGKSLGKFGNAVEASPLGSNGLNINEAMGGRTANRGKLGSDDDRITNDKVGSVDDGGGSTELSPNKVTYT